MVRVFKPSEGVQILPHVKHYAWGGRGKNSFLRRFLGSKDMTIPFAEAWYGTHPQGPSMVAGTNITLTEYLHRHPNALGRTVSDPTNLPFMVKIIEAQKPLSLQIHPNQEQAIAGFERENDKGVPLDSPERCFRDRNAKPEVITALTPFDLFAGFQPLSKIKTDPLCKAILHGLGYPSLVKGTLSFRGDPFILPIAKKIFNLSPKEVIHIGEKVFGPLPKEGKKNPRQSWLKKLWVLYGESKADPSLLLLPFLFFQRLERWESLAILPGMVHAYLEGVGLEIMGCSDNVLRLGLTEKKVDTEAGLRIVHDHRQSHFYSLGSQIPLGSLGFIFSSNRKVDGRILVKATIADFQFSFSLSGRSKGGLSTIKM